jgi:hypothetical protein
MPVSHLSSPAHTLAPDLGGTHLQAAVVHADATPMARRPAATPIGAGIVAIVAGPGPLTRSFGALPPVVPGT